MLKIKMSKYFMKNFKKKLRNIVLIYETNKAINIFTV